MAHDAAGCRHVIHVRVDGVRTSLKGRKHVPQDKGVCVHVISAQRRDDIALGQRDAFVHGIVHAPIRLGDHPRDTVTVLIEHAVCLAAGTAVNDQDLRRVHFALHQKAVERAPHPWVVVDGYYDGREHACRTTDAPP